MIGLQFDGAIFTTLPPAILEATSPAGEDDRDLTSVTPIPAEELILKSANYFDLEGKTLTFTPDSSGGYAVAVGDLTWEDPGGGRHKPDRGPLE